MRDGIEHEHEREHGKRVRGVGGRFGGMGKGQARYSWRVGDRVDEQERLRRALERERERSRALREVGILLDSTVPPDELLRRVLAAARLVTEAQRATLYLVSEDGGSLVSYATEGGEASPEIVLAVGDGIAGTAALARKTMAVSDAYLDPRFDRRWDERTGFRTRAVLATPMLAPDGPVVGVLQVLNRRDDGPFDNDDVSMLEALAAQAGVAIDGAKRLADTEIQNRALREMRERLERALHERDLLLELEQLLSRTDSLDEFLDGAVAGVLRARGAQSGVVLLVDRSNGAIRYRAARRDGARVPCVDMVVPEQTLAVRAVRTGETALVSQSGTDVAGASALEGVARSIVVAPLLGEEGPVGAIELRDKLDGPFTPDDLDLLTLVAANLATGVELAAARRDREHSLRLAAVGRALSNVLHDMRTPMAIISGYVELMSDEKSPAERHTYSESVLRQLDHIQAMIGELMAYVRGDSQLLVQRIHVEPFFTDTVEMLRKELASRGMKVELDLRERGAARFDPAKITRLLHNLARNAADASSKRGGGTFSIRVEREDPYLVMTFHDDGPGIPDGVQQKLFQSFVSQGKVAGTGLGLAIVKKVVDEHAGTIDVDSGEHGTTFMVRIPTNGPPSAPGSSRPPAMAPGAPAVVAVGQPMGAGIGAGTPAEKP